MEVTERKRRVRIQMIIAKLYNAQIGTNESLPVIHSPTLFSAILNASGKKAESLVKDRAFTVSSLFPFIEDETGLERLYLPIVNAPFLQSPVPEKIGKELKGAKLVSQESFLHGISEESLSRESINRTILSKKQASEMVKKTMHNSVSRKISGASETRLFFSFKLSISRGGLWFAFPEKFEKEVKSALKKIMLLGLGKNKNTSSRPFEDFSFQESPVGDRGAFFVNLGLYSPTREELEKFIEKKRISLGYKNEPSLPEFELVKYGGWTESLQKSRLVIKEKPAKYYFKEGSIFPSLGEEVYGARGEYRKLGGKFEHPIYWNGVTLPYYFNLEGDK